MFKFWQRFIFEMTFAIGSDPWKQTSSYQQTKYQQTLDRLGTIPIKHALEIGCAEGHFTVQLATHVDSLIAADISQIATARAKARCALSKLENVSFVNLDLSSDPLPGSFDLIVCSEVLYYINGQTALQAVARKIVDALKPGGYLLTAHANRVDQEPERTNFDWILPFGAELIGLTLANTFPLRLIEELRTPLYRIQIFQCDCATMPSPSGPPKLVEMEQSILPLPENGILSEFSLAFLYNQLQHWRMKYQVKK